MTYQGQLREITQAVTKVHIKLLEGQKTRFSGAT